MRTLSATGVLAAVVAAVAFATGWAAASASPGTTAVSITADAFLINGQPTLEGRTWRGYRVEGLLPNARIKFKATPRV